MKGAKQHPLTNNYAVNMWKASSVGRQWFSSHALSSSENLNDIFIFSYLRWVLFAEASSEYQLFTPL